VILTTTGLYLLPRLDKFVSKRGLNTTRLYPSWAFVLNTGQEFLSDRDLTYRYRSFSHLSRSLANAGDIHRFASRHRGSSDDSTAHSLVPEVGTVGRQPRAGHRVGRDTPRRYQGGLHLHTAHHASVAVRAQSFRGRYLPALRNLLASRSLISVRLRDGSRLAPGECVLRASQSAEPPGLLRPLLATLSDQPCRYPQKRARLAASR